MIKLTNTALIALISATLLVGCGGSDDNDVETNEVTEQVENEGTEVNDDAITTTTTTPTVTTAATTFSSNVMPILVASCQSCHGTSGDFTVTTASATWDNIQQNGGAQVVHDYGNGGMGHPVGDKLTDADSATFQAWINAGAMND